MLLKNKGDQEPACRQLDIFNPYRQLREAMVIYIMLEDPLIRLKEEELNVAAQRGMLWSASLRHSEVTHTHTHNPAEGSRGWTRVWVHMSIILLWSGEASCRRGWSKTESRAGR